MKKTNKKGFTLVELLVVIAILAILATVSVVGYTAFIERATVSNDENVAAQLNQFLTAMKADSTGKYYNEPITPDNVWEVVNAALEDNGTLTDLEPQSLDYGYHYFYKFNKNTEGNYENGEIVVAKKNDVIKQARKGFLAGATDDVTSRYGVGFFEYNGSLYFFLDTKGSDLSIAVNALNNSAGISSWNRIEGESSAEKIQNVIDAVKNVKQDIGNKADYTEKLNGSRLVDKTGQHATNADANQNVIFIEEGASAGDTVTVIASDGTTSTAPAKPLDPGSETTITVPAGAQVSEGALDVAESNNKVTIVIETGSLADIATSESNPGTIEAGFTNTTNVTIKVDNDNGSYTVDATVTVIVKVEGETSTNTEHSFGTGLFPMTSFDIVANENGEYTDVRTGDSKLVYVSNDIGKVSFDITNIKGQTGKPVSKGKVNWTVVSVKLNGRTTDITENLDTYAKFTNNELTFEQDKGIYSIKVKATSDANAEVYNDYTVNVVSIANISGLTLGGTELVDDDKEITLGNAFADENDNNVKKNTTFTLGVTGKTITYNHTESGYSVKVDGNVSLNTSNENFDITGENVTLKTDKGFAITEAELKVKVGSYFEKTYKVTLYDQCQLAKLSNNSQIRYLGDEGAALDISVLFKDNDDTRITLPEGARVFVFSDYGTIPTYPQKSTDWVTIDDDNYEYDEDKGTLIFKNIPANAVGQYKVAWAVETKKTVNGQDEYEYEIVSQVLDIKAVHALNLVNGDNPVINTTTGETVFKQDSFTKVDDNHSHSKENCQDSTNGAHVTTEKNLVLLEDYKLTDRQYLTLKNSTLYGNLFTLDVTKGRNNSTGIIELVGSTMKDTIVKAKEYETTNDPWWKKFGDLTVDEKYKAHIYDKEYSAAAVRVYGTKSTIDNCYISGARAAVRVEVAETTIKDTVLFGGAYGNLDIQNATKVNIENVVTVNQYQYIVDGKTINAKLFGGGVIFANAKEGGSPLYITGKKGLMQFNLMSNNSDEVKHIIDEGKISIQDIASGINSTYQSLLQNFKFTYDSKTYFNAGVLALKTGSKSTGTSLNIKVDGSLALPNGYGKNSNMYPDGDLAVSVATFDNTEMDKSEVKAAFKAQYGFEFSIENLIKEASKYHPDNIGKDGNYKLEYKD